MNPLQIPLRNIQDRILVALEKSGREQNSVTLIGVSKKQPVEKILQAAQAGLQHFGENYVQEWQEKSDYIQQHHPEIAENISWHLIGHLQSNKVKDAVGKFGLIHTVDSLRLAQKISEQAQKLQIYEAALLEVNLGREENKSGFLEEELLTQLEALASLPCLAIEGLMTIPPALPEPETRRPYFIRLRELLEKIQKLDVFKLGFCELSMGMSDDFEIAIEEGATMVRVGTALFGARS